MLFSNFNYLSLFCYIKHISLQAQTKLHNKYKAEIGTRAFREFIIPLKKALLVPLSLSLSLSLPLPLPVLAQFYFLFIRKKKEFCLVLSLLAMN